MVNYDSYKYIQTANLHTKIVLQLQLSSMLLKLVLQILIE